MKKLKVLTIVGTRPEIIRLSRIIPKLDKYCDHIFVHTGQNYDYELNQIFFDDLGLREPDIFMNAAGISPAQTIGNIFAGIDGILESEKPDALLVLGDTNSCLSIIPAKRRQIPTFHMEAGNRCFDMRVPEEINRKIIDHVADINLTYSPIARDYLLREGISPDTIIKTGSPMFEVISHYKDNIDSSNILSDLGLTEGNYFLVSAHREENIEDDVNFEKLSNILNMLATQYSIPVIVSTHPRTKKRINNANNKFNSLIQFLKPLSFSQYVKLQLNARAVLSDSGTISEESAILNFRALNLREMHERPEGMDEAVVMMVGLNAERVVQGLNILIEQSTDTLRQPEDYKVPNVSDKVLRILHSYTDYINRVVWKKYRN